MGAQQPWFEALQLDAEQEAKLEELQEAVAAVVNVSELPPPPPSPPVVCRRLLDCR